MARPPRLQVRGATYHVTSRGAGGIPIAEDALDRDRILDRLNLAIGRFDWTCLGYCVMTTHYHFLLTIREANLAAGMQWLNGLYARGFNRRHGRTGHLFQGRYDAVHVTSDAHFLEVIRYVALNPVRAGLCRHPSDWPWSSYGALVGDHDPEAVIASPAVLELFGPDQASAIRRLRAFVDSTAHAEARSLTLRV